MLQVALKVAPGSTANLPISTSPCTYAEDFSDRVPDNFNLPEKLPSKSAFVPVIVPLTNPDLPITIFSLVLILPYT